MTESAVVETRTETGELVAVTLQDEEYRIVEVLYEVGAPLPLGIEAFYAADGALGALKRGGRTVYRAADFRKPDPFPVGYDAAGAEAGWSGEPSVKA